jgi:hypothetical protein
MRCSCWGSSWCCGGMERANGSAWRMHAHTGVLTYSSTMPDGWQSQQAESRSCRSPQHRHQHAELHGTASATLVYTSTTSQIRRLCCRTHSSRTNSSSRLPAAVHVLLLLLASAAVSFLFGCRWCIAACWFEHISFCSAAPSPA